jgi:hypothetical protein
LVFVHDPQDLTVCLREMEQRLSQAVQQWRAQGPGYTVTADPTGGTKGMSAAVGLVARRWNCHLRYVGGSSRTRRGVGTVESSRDIVFSGANGANGHAPAYLTFVP